MSSRPLEPPLPALATLSPVDVDESAPVEGLAAEDGEDAAEEEEEECCGEEAVMVGGGRVGSD